MPNLSMTSVPFLTAFSPTSVGNLALWLDGKDPAGTGTAPSIGATVSTWVDKSTSAKNATAAGTPTYLSGGGINFNGSSYFSNMSFSQNLSQRSIFIVMQETVHNSVFGVFPLIPTPSSVADYDSTSGMTIETANGLRFYGNNGSYQSDIGNASLLVKAVYNDNMNVTVGSGFLNGTNVRNVTAGYTAGTCSGYGIAARWLGNISATYALNGKIYEIMFFNSPLGTTDRSNIEGYLSQKWGLTGSLPAGHPGLTQTFFSETPSLRSLGGLTSTLTITNVPYITGLSPTSAGGCVLWLDGKDPAGTGVAPSTGDPVYTWIDKSVSVKNGTSSGTPTYVEGGGINFNGNCFFYNLAFAQNLSQRSIFIVYKETTHTVNSKGIFNLIPNPSTGQDSETVTGLSIEATYGWRVWGNGGGDQSDFFLTSPVVKGIFNNNMNERASSGFLNGTSTTSRTASYTAGTCSGYGVGARWQGSTSMNSKLDGVIYEILFFNTELGLSDRQSVEGYLAQKWSLTGSLPAGHPGLTQTFFPSASPLRSLAGITSTVAWTNKS
jgi:hypothetical protein